MITNTCEGFVPLWPSLVQRFTWRALWLPAPCHLFLRGSVVCVYKKIPMGYNYLSPDKVGFLAIVVFAHGTVSARD